MVTQNFLTKISFIVFLCLFNSLTWANWGLFPGEIFWFYINTGVALLISSQVFHLLLIYSLALLVGFALLAKVL